MIHQGSCVNGAEGRSSEVDVATSTLAAGLDEQIEATGRWRSSRLAAESGHQSEGCRRYVESKRSATRGSWG